MKIYCLITGILCIVYYLVLVFYSGRLRSTFSVFWVITGGVHLLLGCMPLSAYVYTILKVLCIVLWIWFIGTEALIISAMFSGCSEQADCILVLGAQVRGRRITDSLQRRLDRAVIYLNRFPETTVVVSGGRGPGEDITEADAMAGYLISCGISPDRIIRETQSASTRENFAYSRKYTDPESGRIGIVTNGFHMYRASVIAAQEGYRHICRIPASSNPVFQINYLTREFFALTYFLLCGVKRGRIK